MGILGRINAVIQSNLNSAIDRMSDPAKEIELLISDMQDAQKKAKQELVQGLAAARQTAKRCEAVEQEVALWYRRAEQAVRQGDDDLAREALAQKAQVERKLADTRRALQEQEVYSAELRRSMDQLEARLEECKLRKETLKEMARAAKGQGQGLRGTRAFDEFDRLAGRIEALETETQLTEELEGRRAATEAKFARLDGPDPAVEEALARLKQKLED